MKVFQKTRVQSLHVGDNKPFVDIQSKIFIIAEAILGVNRLALFPDLRDVYVYLAFAYALIAIALTVYFNLLVMNVESYLILTQYIFNALFAFFSCKRMRNYFVELSRFDREVGCRPRNSLTIYSKVAANALTLVLTGLIFYLSHVLDIIVFSLPLALLSVQIVQSTEVYFNGHLFDLMLPRVQLINYYVESSLSFNYLNEKKMDEYLFFPQRQEIICDIKMKKIMDLYQIIVSAYEILIEAIKWQILVIITFSFMTTLAFSYRVALIVIHGNRNILAASVNIGMLLVFLVTMAAPCSSSDRVHHQALRLRELLATKLYDNKLDKWSRSIARALLALIHSRDLSFSIMNMFSVDVSLPFTFTSLLVTYLIILLQFEKVINN